MDFTILLGTGLAGATLLALLLARLRVGPGPAYVATAVFAAWASRTWLAPEGGAGLALVPGFTGFAEPAVLVALPWIHRTGVRLGLAASRGDVARHFLRAVIRTPASLFFLGGIAYLWLPWPSPFLQGGKLQLAFALAAVWAIPAAPPRSRGPRDTPGDEAGEAQSGWGALLGLLAFALVIDWPVRRVDTGSASAFRFVAETVGGSVASGVLAGALGSLVLRSLRAAPTWAIDLATAYGSYVLASILPGFPLASVLLAGATSRLLAPRSREVSSWLLARQGAGPNPLALTAGAVLSLGLGLLVPGILDSRWLGRSLGIWLASCGIQLLLMLFLGGVSTRGSFRSSWRSSLSLAWAFHPGTVALAVLAAGGLLEPGPGALLSRMPESCLAVGGQVLLAAMLIQGGLHRRLFAATPDHAAPESRRWDELEALHLALSECREELGELEATGGISDLPARAIRSALEREVARLDLERLELLRLHPQLERERWTRALRRLLARAEDAIERARAHGQIPDATARELERTFVERWHRASELSVAEALRTGEQRVKNPAAEDSSHPERS